MANTVEFNKAISKLSDDHEVRRQFIALFLRTHEAWNNVIDLRKTVVQLEERIAELENPRPKAAVPKQSSLSFPGPRAA